MRSLGQPADLVRGEGSKGVGVEGMKSRAAALAALAVVVAGLLLLWGRERPGASGAAARSTNALPSEASLTPQQCRGILERVRKDVFELKARFGGLQGFTLDAAETAFTPTDAPRIEYYHDVSRSGPVNKAGQREYRANADGCILHVRVYPSREALLRAQEMVAGGLQSLDYRARCEGGGIIIALVDCPDAELANELRKIINRAAGGRE